MQKTGLNLKKSLSLILCIVLIAAMALFTTGCNDKSKGGASYGDTSVEESSQEMKVYGDGETKCFLTVTDKDGVSTNFTIFTDEKTVGNALLALGLIEGEAGNYGLYIKSVNGITADYDKDGTYWAFYINGEYAMSGVDTTEIVAGATYSLKVEK